MFTALLFFFLCRRCRRRCHGKLTKRNQQYVLGVVDGQHRLRALKMLADAKMWAHSERNVVVEVFDARDERDIEELYAEINRRERREPYRTPPPQCI